MTSRRSLDDLPGARHLRLDVFSPAEALDYLRLATGADRVDGDPDTAADICRVVGHLPLALGLTAARIAAQPSWTLADHLRRVRTRRAAQRLDDKVEASIGLSYDSLDTEHRRLLRMLVLHPGQDVDVHAVAALAGIDQATARVLLDHLLANHLLQQHLPMRYEPHDAIRVHATNRSDDEDRDHDRHAARARLIDHYLHTASVAMDLVYPSERHRRPHVPAPRLVTIALADRGAARDWLDAEQANLFAVAAGPAAQDRPDCVPDLAAIVYRHLIVRGHYSEAITLHCRALGIAARYGDDPRHARTLNSLGALYQRVGRYQLAIDHLERALAINRALRDQRGEIDVLINLGQAMRQSGRGQEARSLYRHALDLLRANEDPLIEAILLNSIGALCGQLGQDEDGLGYLSQALAVAERIGHPHLVASTLTNLGSLQTHTGSNGLAANNLRRAIDMYGDVGDDEGRAGAQLNLAAVLTTLGSHAEAADHYRQALAQFRILGNPAGQTEALNGLGELSLLAGDTAEAMAHYLQAHRYAAETGQQPALARALTGLGDTCRRFGDVAQATRHWQEALLLYTGSGSPRASELAARLAGLEAGRGVQ